MDGERIGRVRDAMAQINMDALVCRLPENIVMLSGHWPLNGLSFLLFPLEGRPLIVVPHCEENESRQELWDAECRSFAHGTLAAGDAYLEIGEQLKEASARKGWRRIGIERSFESVAPPWNAAEPAIPASATQAMLESVYGADHLLDATGLLMELRSRKTPDEVKRLRTANEIATIGLLAFWEGADVGVSGVELVATVEATVMVRGTGHGGAQRVRGFAQVATGARETAFAYRPMEISTTRKLRNGETALLELAVVADGFWADRTRSKIVGTPSARARDMYNAVKRAQAQAIQAVAPGALTGDVDSAARNIIHEAGWTDDEFLHVTGHGIGFRYHEPVPLISPGGTTELQEGMVHTVEPGLYCHDAGGIRVEDDVVVTVDGVEVLGPSPATLT
jgi:Xaa-Pro dipeptidase